MHHTKNIAWPISCASDCGVPLRTTAVSLCFVVTPDQLWGDANSAVRETAHMSMTNRDLPLYDMPQQHSSFVHDEGLDLCAQRRRNTRPPRVHARITIHLLHRSQLNALLWQTPNKSSDTTPAHDLRLPRPPRTGAQHQRHAA
jgi:hypothetical protein